MPGERTIYRRIQVVLDYAKEKNHSNLDELARYITKRQPTNFIYYWRDRNSDTIKHDYSRTSIILSVRFCSELGLILPRDWNSNQEVRLTKVGTSACDPLRFPVILGRQICEHLSESDIPIRDLERTITRILTGEPPKAPTTQAIWLSLPEAKRSIIKEDKFRQLLNLLGECKVLVMSQKRIFLPRTPT